MRRVHVCAHWCADNECVHTSVCVRVCIRACAFCVCALVCVTGCVSTCISACLYAHQHLFVRVCLHCRGFFFFFGKTVVFPKKISLTSTLLLYSIKRKSKEQRGFPNIGKPHSTRKNVFSESALSEKGVCGHGRRSSGVLSGGKRKKHQCPGGPSVHSNHS